MSARTRFNRRPSQEAHRDKKPGRHQLDQSPTAPKVYPFNTKTMTEAEWLGRTA